MRVLLTGIALVLLVSGCSPTPRAVRPAAPADMHASRDGHLRYQVPSGWFDASADSQAAAHVAWIVRNDYGGSITVDEIRLDEAAQRKVGVGGMEQLVRLVLPLSVAARSATVRDEPRYVDRGEESYWLYELADGGGGSVRVAIVRGGDRVYSITLLVPEDAVDPDGLRALHDEFVRTLLWPSL